MERELLELKLNDLEKIASASPTYFCEIPLELIQELKDFVQLRKPTVADEPEQIHFEELGAYVGEVRRLKTLCFDDFEKALNWVKENADEIFGYDKDDGYIDFQLGRLDCAMERTKLGCWKMTDITGLCGEKGNTILEILTNDK